MSEIAMVLTAQRYSQGFTYEGYFNQLGDTRRRFAEDSTAFRLAPSDAQFFKDVVHRLGGLKVLAIVEDWCLLLLVSLLPLWSLGHPFILYGFSGPSCVPLSLTVYTHGMEEPRW